ncbi:glycosyltransferase family 2 protein [Pasteurella multocida subsp. multocida]|uniref:Glycosyltransferase family 2 protein n=1 Tax=Pasteurella multocida TaxID=747 RepID=A0A9X3UP30_PASMD|nr:glycosyltransferase family 2 protein [Pasteurella multocida]MBF6980209.1 glycosyltransferase family 2 protein [Pasteurella multocida]MBF6984806.1 glycosyltransferase family 2 protein [Pasteurella multocida]MDA5608230.1 glycosyltransferase family 2 protein [Pasteurella multocida subsp. multocida]MDA5610334.1 glycosyltransferase family 2 protein [Pasteurella multocida]MDA5613219.1 glycosyltransferase family 2 protein [Pasteurella multocida]
MPTLSVAMIVKNEAEHLAQCLDTVKDWVDDIVILDSGSTDNTKEIALSYGAKFYAHCEWPGFGRQRQIAQQYVTTDYVLWLDADERVTPELRESIQRAVAKNEKNVVYKISRLSEVFGRKIRHSNWYPDFVLRLYPTALTQYNDEPVHEKVMVPSHAKVEKLAGDLEHYTYKDMHHYLVKSAGYAKAWAEKREKAGKKGSLLVAFTHAIGCFAKMYIFNAGFLDGKQGLLLAVLSAHSTFVKYADLWVRTQTKK